MVVANISYSKIESKSQQAHVVLIHCCCCCKYQLFKDRKQIKTESSRSCWPIWLLQISVIQRSKANHNWYGRQWDYLSVVANISYSKIESKSQPWSVYRLWWYGCCKYQLFKDRKQITTRWSVIHSLLSCCKYQLFKDRKQITTPLAMVPWSDRLLQISVIQRSKANHNTGVTITAGTGVVANISYSKIESKSQHVVCLENLTCGCCKYQLFKDRKQITTADRGPVSYTRLLQISVIQRSKANHNSTIVF